MSLLVTKTIVIFILGLLVGALAMSMWKDIATTQVAGPIGPPILPEDIVAPNPNPEIVVPPGGSPDASPPPAPASEPAPAASPNVEPPVRPTP